MTIFLDEKPLKYYGLYLLKNHSHPSPTIVNNVIDMPGIIGQYHFGSEIKERPFNHPIGILEMSRMDTQQKLRNFMMLLFDEFGQVREIKLRYGYEPDKYYLVRFDGSIDPERIFEYAEFELPLVAYDPLAYATVTSDEIAWGSEIITFEYRYLLGHEGGGGAQKITEPETVNVEAEGLAVRPIIEIEGSARSLTITNGKYRIVLPEFNNASWSIDCEKYTVTKDGKNEFGLVDLRDFYLLPGNNAVDISGTGIDVEMTIKYRDKFV